MVIENDVRMVIWQLFSTHAQQIRFPETSAGFRERHDCTEYFIDLFGGLKFTIIVSLVLFQFITHTHTYNASSGGGGISIIKFV